MALSPPGRRGCNPASLFQFSRDREGRESVSLFDFVHEIPTSDGDNSFPGSPSVSPADATPASPLLCSPPLAWLLPAMASSYCPSSSSSSRFAPPDSGLSAHPKPFSGPQASSITHSINQYSHVFLLSPSPISQSPPTPTHIHHPLICFLYHPACVYLSVCLSICLTSVCLFVYLSVLLSVYRLSFILIFFFLYFFFSPILFISFFSSYFPLSKCPAKFMQSFPFLPLFTVGK